MILENCFSPSVVNGFVDDVSVAHANFHGMFIWRDSGLLFRSKFYAIIQLTILDVGDVNREIIVAKNDLSIRVKRGTEGERTHVRFVLQQNALPVDMERFVAVLAVLHVRVVGQARVEVRHQRADVLRRGEPAVDVVASVEEPTGGDGDVGDRMSIERKLERKLHCHRAPVRLRKQLVDGEVGALRVDALPMERRVFLVLDHGAIVILVEIFVDRRDAVVRQRSVRLAIGDVNIRPLDLRTVLAALGNIRRPIRCWDANFRSKRGACRRLRCCHKRTH